MTEEQKKIKKYVNAIERHLHMPLKMKARINSDLATEIHLRMEAGATADEVIQEMGSPKEVADRFNEEMEVTGGERQPLRIFFVCMAAFCAVIVILLFLRALLQNWEMAQEIKDASVSIIGGADGPTSVFIAKSISPFGKGIMVLGTAAGFLSAYFLTGKRNSSVKYRCMFLSAAGTVCTVLPSVQLCLLKFRGIAVRVSGRCMFILIIGVALNTATFIMALRKRKDG